MNVAELESLMQELLQGIQAVSQSGEELSDDFQGMLAQTLNLLVTEIDNARRAQAPLPPTELAPSPEAQLLWILAGQQEDVFLNYLQQYPSEQTQQLLNNPAELQRTIQFLHAMMPSGRPIVVDGIEKSYLNSSNIWGTAYDPKSQRMRVRFNDGAEYEYDGVPINIYRAFNHGQASAKTKGQNEWGKWWPGKNPSMGASFWQYIRQSGFPYRKIK